MSFRHWLLSALLVLLSQSLSAEVLVLVHGYHSSGLAWRHSGVMQGLNARGWSDGGDYFLTSARIYNNRPSLPQAEDTAVTVDLPSEAPIHIQASILKRFLTRIELDYPDQPIIIVGHSAGGVIARYQLVLDPQASVIALVSLASPHLGTASAEMGKLAGDTPVAAVAPFMGLDTINRSEDLYEDLRRERYGSLLHWLNRQPHPDIQWISLVRDKAFTGLEGFIVPGYSQDLRNVVALQNRARSYLTAGDHELHFRDSAIIADIVADQIAKTH